MRASKTPGSVTRDEAIAVFARDGCSEPRFWANGPGDRFGRHEHRRAKVLFCLEGSIVFHTDDGDVALEAGDRLDLPVATPHAATVGPSGCACVEAWGP
jgi:mannose-6-phosphate isomerase-like protein (cupin superfamily)